MSGVIEEAKASRPVADFLATPKKLLIDGKWVAAVSGKTFEVKNPATADTIARAAEGDRADVDLAVRAARRAAARAVPGRDQLLARAGLAQIDRGA